MRCDRRVTGLTDRGFSHIHVSIKNKSGTNIFALSEDEIVAGGRKDAPFKDVQYISQAAEHFLAGILEGLPDGELRTFLPARKTAFNAVMQSCPCSAPLSTRTSVWLVARLSGHPTSTATDLTAV